jgi:two-component system sensor histidine kinase QseC
MAQHTQGFETLTLADGKSWRVFAALGRSRDVQIHVAEQADSREEILWPVQRGFLPPLIIALPLLLIGLGWSIVRHIAVLQRIDVQVGHSVDLGGLKVTLRYPQNGSQKPP